MSLQDNLKRIEEIDRLIGNGMMLAVVSFGQFVKLKQERNFLVAQIQHYRPKN